LAAALLTAALLTTLAGLVLPALLLAGFVLSALLTGFSLTLLRVALLLLAVSLIVLLVRHRDVLRYSRVAINRRPKEVTRSLPWRFLTPAAAFICDALKSQKEFLPKLVKGRAGLEPAQTGLYSLS
jgi:hypothetical protein